MEHICLYFSSYYKGYEFMTSKNCTKSFSITSENLKAGKDHQQCYRRGLLTKHRNQPLLEFGSFKLKVFTFNGAQ